YPRDEEAYLFAEQYQFGDDILVAPITTPAVNGFSTVEIWFPPGNDWYEWHSGTLIKGGQVLEREFILSEYPIYIKAGGIIPMYNDQVKNLTDNPDELKIGIFPGASYKTKIYEDNGDDQKYDKEYAFTTVETHCLQNKMEVVIHPREGSYAGMKKAKRYRVTLYGSHVPERVLINNKQIDFTSKKEDNSWSYNGDLLALEIAIPETDCDKELKLEILYKDTSLNINNGIVGRFQRLGLAMTELKYKKRLFVMP